MFKNKKRILLIGVALAVTGAVGAAAYINRQPSENPGQDNIVQSHPTYKLELDSNADYPDPASVDLAFKITDEKNQTFKSFEEVHGDRLHLAAVRKDRGEIIYFDPSYDDSTGSFTVNGAAFPSAGEYRIFAEFTPGSAQMDPEGSKLSAAPYQDIQIGSANDYGRADIGPERFKSSDNGFDINVFLAPHDPSDPGLAAGSSSSFAVSVNKDGSPYRQLQDYKESRGSMMLFGPNLEYIHIHTTNDDVPDTYVLSFSVDFPSPGTYKGFLLTQTEGKINYTDYVLAVSEEPTSNQGEAPPAGHPSH